MPNHLKLLKLSNQQRLVGYVNALADVTEWVTLVNACQIPPLNNPPDGYADFVMKYVQVKVDALNWSDSLFPQASKIASAFVNMNAALMNQQAVLASAVTTLKANPEDATALAAARTSLAESSRLLLQPVETVGGLKNLLERFKRSLSGDATVLSGFATTAAAAEGANQKDVERLRFAIESLQKSIDNQKKMLLLEKLVAWDLKIFMVIFGTSVGLTVGNPVGGLIFGLTGSTLSSFVNITPGEMVSPEILASQESAVKAVNAEIGDLNSQIAFVKTLASTVSKIAADDSKVSKGLVVTSNYWTAIDTQLQDIRNHLQTASREADLKRWSQVEQSSSTAFAIWSELFSVCDNIKDIKLIPPVKA